MRVSEATATFLEAAASDLQLQLGRSGVVAAMRAIELSDGVTLVATVRIGSTTAELTGTGASLVSAYGDLHRHVAEPILATAYREILSG